MQFPFKTLGQLATLHRPQLDGLVDRTFTPEEVEDPSDRDVDAANAPDDPLARIDAILKRTHPAPSAIAPPPLETPKRPTPPSVAAPTQKPTKLNPFAAIDAYLGGHGEDTGTADARDVTLKADQDSEPAFRSWYDQQARTHGLNPNPDAPDQHYDYRAAFRAGAQPDASGHWPSTFKTDDHPNLIVGGFNTKTGQRVPGTARASERELVRLGWAPEDAKRLTAQQDAQEALMPPTPALAAGKQERAIQDRYVGDAATHEAAMTTLSQQIAPLQSKVTALRADLDARAKAFEPERVAFQAAADAYTAQVKRFEAAGRPADQIPALEQARQAFNRRVEAFNVKQTALGQLTTAYNGTLGQLRELDAKRQTVAQQARATADQANREFAALNPPSLDDVGPGATLAHIGAKEAQIPSFVSGRGPRAQIPGITAPEKTLALPDPDPRKLVSINGVVQAALKGEKLPTRDLSHVQPPTWRQSFTMGMANGLQQALDANPFMQGLGLVAGAASTATGLFRDAPTAIGEQAFGQSLPGHEQEPKTLIGRLASHAQMILSGHPGAVAPMSVPGAMLNPPDSSDTLSPVERGILAKGGLPPDQVQTRGRGEMGALEVGRRGLDIVAQLLTDPVAVATMRLHTLGEAPAAAGATAAKLIAGDTGGATGLSAQQLNTVGQVSGAILGAAFTADALKGAADVASNPNATPEDVATAVLNAAVMTVPQAAHYLGTGLKLANARLARAAEAARAEAEAARTITPHPSDIVVQPTRVGPPGPDDVTGAPGSPSPGTPPPGPMGGPKPGPSGPETVPPMSRPAETQPATADAQPTAPPYQRPTMPTAMQAELQSRGFTPEQIATMTPEQATDIIDSGHTNNPSPEVPPELGPDATTPQGYTGPDRRKPTRVDTAEEDARYAASRADRERMANGFKQTSVAAQENGKLRAEHEAAQAGTTDVPRGEAGIAALLDAHEAAGLGDDTGLSAVKQYRDQADTAGEPIVVYQLPHTPGELQANLHLTSVPERDAAQMPAEATPIAVIEPRQSKGAPASKPATSQPVSAAPEGKIEKAEGNSAPVTSPVTAPEKPWAEMSDEEQAAALMADLDAEKAAAAGANHPEREQPSEKTPAIPAHPAADVSTGPESSQTPRWRKDSPYAATPDNPVEDVLPTTLDEQNQRHAAIRALEQKARRSKQDEKDLKALRSTYEGTWAELDQHVEGVDLDALRAKVEGGTTPAETATAQPAAAGETERYAPHPLSAEDRNRWSALIKKEKKGKISDAERGEMKDLTRRGSDDAYLGYLRSKTDEQLQEAHRGNLSPKNKSRAAGIPHVEHERRQIEHVLRERGLPIPTEGTDDSLAEPPTGEGAQTAGGFSVGDRVKFRRGTGTIQKFVETRIGPRARVQLDESALTPRDRANFGTSVVQHFDLDKLTKLDADGAAPASRPAASQPATPPEGTRQTIGGYADQNVLHEDGKVKGVLYERPEGKFGSRVFVGPQLTQEGGPSDLAGALAHLKQSFDHIARQQKARAADKAEKKAKSADRELPTANSHTLVTALGEGRTHELLAANDWALGDDLGVYRLGVSDSGRSTGGGPRDAVPFRDVVQWIASPEADAVSADARWQALLDDARQAIGLRDPAQYDAPQRGVAYPDMTEQELRDLLDHGVGDEPVLAARELTRRQDAAAPTSKPAASQPASQREQLEAMSDADLALMARSSRMPDAAKLAAEILASRTAKPTASKPAVSQPTKPEFSAADASRLRKQLQTAQWALVGEKQRWEKAMREGMAGTHTQRILDTVKAYEKDIAELTATLTAHDAMPPQELGGYKVGDYVIQLHPRDPNDRTVYVVKALVPEENALRLEAADGSGRGAPAAPMNVRSATVDEWQRGSARTARGSAKNYEVGDVVKIAGEPFDEVTITRITGEDVEVQRPNGYTATYHASRITNRIDLTEAKAMERLKAIHKKYGVVSSDGDVRRVREASNADQREAVLAKIAADHHADKAKSDAKAAERAKELAAQVAAMQAEDRALLPTLQTSGKLAWRTVQMGKEMYWRPIEGKPVPIAGAPADLRFVVFRSPETKLWTVTEQSTGRSAGTGKTQAAAVEATVNAFATVNPDAVRKSITQALAKTPPNPYLAKGPAAIGAASPAGTRAAAAEQAQALWDTFDANERAGVKLGLFPAAKMPTDTSHDVTVALMKIAERQPAAPTSRPAKSQPTTSAAAPATGSFKVEISDGKTWSSNQLRYATKDEAEAAGSELMSRWMGAHDMRVAPSTDPVNRAWDAKAGKSVEVMTAGGVEFVTKPLISKEDAAADGKKAKALEEAQRLIDEMKARQAREDGEPQFSRVYEPTDPHGDEPQRAKADDGRVRAGLGDEGTAARILASSLYSKNISEVATKELLQNAFDAVRGRAEAAVKVILGDDRSGDEGPAAVRYVEVQDSGAGMTRAEIETVFTNLFESGKRDQATASGGFGIAKASFLLGGDKVRVETIVHQPVKTAWHGLGGPRGRRVKYSFTATPAELTSARGVTIHEEVLDQPHGPTGTRIRTYLPTDASFYHAERFATDVASFSLGLPAAFSVYDLDYNNRPRLLASTGPQSEQFKGYTRHEAVVPGANLLIWTSPEIDPEPTSSATVRVLNNGVYQLDAYQGTSKTGFGPKIQFPKTIIIDVRPTVPEGDPHYPFVANREGLRDDFQKGMRDGVFDAAIAPLVVRERDLLARTYAGMPSFDVPELGPVSVYDVGSRLTPEELATMMREPEMQALTKAIVEQTRQVLDQLLTVDERAVVERVGLLFDAKTHGVYIPKPAPNRTDAPRASIFLNPFEHLAVTDRLQDGPGPDRAAAGVYHTMVHEAVHLRQGGHDEAFTSALGHAFRTLGARFEIGSLDKLLNGYADPTDPAALRPGLARVFSLYEASRGRAATADDALSRTGRHSQEPGADGGAKGDTPGSAGSDRGNAPQRVTQADLVAMVKVVRALREADLDFPTAVQSFHDMYGAGARALDRAFELAWKRWTGDDRKVADVVAAPPAPQPTKAPPTAKPLHTRIFDLLRERPHLFDQPNSQAFRREVARILGNVNVSEIEGNIDALNDAAEAAIARAFHTRLEDRGGVDGLSLPDQIALAQEAEARLPRAHRTLEKQKLQQFSTPLPIAVAVDYAAQIRDTDHVLEPTAGTGNLLVAVPAVDALTATEISDRRADLLRASGYTVLHGDYLSARISPAPTVIVSNPPWGKYSTGKYGRGVALGFAPSDVAERFVAKMLRDLADGGRLVAVMPTTMLDATSFKKWLADTYTVRAIIKSPPKAYDTRATSVESLLLVVDKVTGDGTLPRVVDAPDWPAYSDAVRGIHDRSPISPAEGRAPDTPRPDSGRGSDRVPGSSRSGRTGGGRHTPVGAGRPADVVAGGTDTGGRGSVDAGGTAPGALEEPAGAAALGVPGPSDDTRREAAASRYFAPYLRRTALRGQPHPKLLVEAKQLAGVPYPPITIQPTPSMAAAIKAGRVSVEQAEQALAALQANSGEKPFGYLAADAVGVGKSREIAMTLLGAMDRAKAAGQPLRLMLTTKTRDNVEDLLDEIHYVASGQTKGQGGTVPFEVYRIADDYPGAKKSGNAYEPLPKAQHGLYVIDSFNVADYRQALADAALHGIVGDEVQRFTNEQAKIGASWLNLHAQVMRKTPRDQQFFAYFTATPAQKVEDYRYLYGLRLWPVDGFADWLQLVTGSLDEAKAKKLADDTERGSKAPLDDLIKDTDVAVVGTDSDNPNPHQGGKPQKSWDSYVSDIFAQKLTPAEAEQIPREWKILGRFSARDLWRAGTTFEIHQFALTPEQKQRYNQFVDLALDIYRTAYVYGLYDKTGRSSRFGVTGMLQFAAKRIQMQPALEEGVRLAKQFAAEGYQPVLSIINVSEMTADKGNLLAAIEKINTRMVDTDPDDPDAGPVDQGEIPEALVDRARLLDRVRDLGAFPDPVDYIATELGQDKVAFIIGKEKASRRQASAEFQSGERTYAVISSAGSTGINLDQRIETPLAPGHGRRVFLDIQYEWSAMEGVQRYGRVDRASSIHPPRLVAITSGNAAEKKFLATIANRMASLGALSKGGADSTGAAGNALEEFEILGDDALAAARRAYEESDEPTRRSFATIKSAFRDPNRNGKSPDSADFDPFKPNVDAHGIGMKDFQLPLLLMPIDQANAFWEKFIRYRDELRAASGEQQLMRSARFSGEVLSEHPLKAHLTVYGVKNAENRKFGILVGLISPEMPRLRELLKNAEHEDAETTTTADGWQESTATADIRFKRRYVTFSAGDRIITGLQVPWRRIPAIAESYGLSANREQLDTPEKVLAHLRAGETITLAVTNPDSGKPWVLRMRPSDKRVAIDHARMQDRTQLLNNGAGYQAVGNYWHVTDLAKFLERWPVPDQGGASPTPKTPPASSGGSGGGFTAQSAVIPGAKEFVEQDVAPAVAHAAEQVAKARDEIRALFAPDTIGTASRLFADSMRANLAAFAQKTQRARRVMQDAQDAFEPMAGRAERGDEAAIAEFLRFTDVMDGIAPLDSLPEAVRPIAQTMRAMNRKRLRQIQALGRLRNRSGDDYFGRIWRTDAEGNVLRKTEGSARRPLQGRGAFLKQRTWKTMREGIDAGAIPLTYNPVEMFLLKLVEQDKWIMGRSVLLEGKSLGVAKFVRVGSEAPAGWKPYHESFGTVWGPPTIPVKEAYDQKLMDGLYTFARSLGVGHVRKVAVGGQRWGYAVGSHHIVTKFAGPEGVLMHEIGHILDERFGLREKWVHNPTMRQELRNLADLRFEGTTKADVPPSRLRYYRKGEEKIANLVHAFLYAPDRAKKVAPNAYWALHNLVKGHATLRPLLDLQRDGRSLTLAVNEARQAVGGAVIKGRYYGPPDATRILDNYLSPGLRGNVAFDTYRQVGNVMNQAQLGLSGFHLTMTGIEAMVSKLAQGIEELSRGEFAHGGRSLAEAPVATLTTLVKGHRALAQLYAKDANARLLVDAIDQIIQAGGGIHRDQTMRAYDNRVQAVVQAFRRGNYVGAALRAPLAAFELPTKFVMEWWVPRLKLGAFLDMAAMELRTLGPEPSLTEVRRVLGGVWDSIDNRFGQLVYDNLFWNNALKDLGMGTFRALGWNTGTTREVFGAPLGQGAQLAALALDKPVGGYRPVRMKHTGYDQDGSRIFEPTREPWLTHKGAYGLLALVFGVGLIGAIYQYLHTGEGPKSLRDLYYPRTGGKRPDGKPERASFPSYAKDVYAFSQAPLTTVGHKLQPELNLFYEILSNEDFYGTEIRGSGDPIPEQAKDVWAHVLKSFEPFTIRSLEQRLLDKGDRGVSGAESFIGITPAPASIYRTKAEDLMRSYMPPTHRTQDQMASAQTRGSLRDAIRSGDASERARILAEGSLSRRQVANATRAAGQTPLQSGFSHLTADQAFAVYTAATPEERATLRAMLVHKGGLIKDAPPAQQADLWRRYRAAFGLPVAAVAR